MKYDIIEFMCPKKQPINRISLCSECCFEKAYKKLCDEESLPFCGRSPIGEHVIHEIIKKLKGNKITKEFIIFIVHNDDEGYKKRVALWHLAKGYKVIGEEEPEIIQEEMDI